MDAIAHDGDVVVRLGVELLPEDAKRAARRLLPNSFGKLPDEGIECEMIGGGITNALVKLSVSAACSRGAEHEPVLVRVFGENTDQLIDRDRELAATVRLNHFGFGARVLATFKNGRVEEFLPSHTLEPQDLPHPAVMSAVAKRLAKFHAVDMHDACGGNSGDRIAEVDGVKSQQSTLFATIRDWFERAAKLDFSDNQHLLEQHSKIDFAAARTEIDEVEKMCMQVESPVVWSHNDLLSGNILVLGGKKLPDGEDDVQFIDFEYGSHAPRGFDIGNHWNEYAGFDLEWERFPARDKQEVFVREYLSAGGAAPERRDVERLVREANVYALASHLFWGYWAILQARWSQIDFDYMSYYGKRLTRMRQLMRTVAAD